MMLLLDDISWNVMFKHKPEVFLLWGLVSKTMHEETWFCRFTVAEQTQCPNFPEAHNLSSGSRFTWLFWPLCHHLSFYYESLIWLVLLLCYDDYVLSQRLTSSCLRFECNLVGTVNIHPSLLPLYRGAAPVQRALQVQTHRMIFLARSTTFLTAWWIYVF